MKARFQSRIFSVLFAFFKSHISRAVLTLAITHAFTTHTQFYHAFRANSRFDLFFCSSLGLDRLKRKINRNKKKNFKSSRVICLTNFDNSYALFFLPIVGIKLSLF